MPESIYTRVKRIVSGSIYDTVDAMERAGGTSVMREAIREVERVVDDVKSERDAATSSRLHSVRLQGMYKERLNTLQEKAEFAMEQGREDLAEAALHRQVEFEEQIVALAKSEEEATEKERHLEECLASLTVRLEQMNEELNAFEMARVSATSQAGVPEETQKERRVERAEAAFDRALSGAGVSVGITRTNMEHAAKVGVIDAMQKSSLIAKRMAALREQKKAS